jgi:hypothetical protein
MESSVLYFKVQFFNFKLVKRIKCQINILLYKSSCRLNCKETKIELPSDGMILQYL